MNANEPAIRKPRGHRMLPRMLPLTTDLVAGARQVMAAQGFTAEFSEDVTRQVASLGKERARPWPPDRYRDQRRLLWSSIDNRTSRDLDQIEVAEQLPGGVIRLRVAIADVDAFAPRGTAIDDHAARNTTSVYTGVAVFPMLPDRLSTDLTSLNANQERLAVVVQMEVAEDGSSGREDVYLALVKNQARLDYESVAEWLQGAGPLPAAAARVPGIDEQLRLQNEAAARMRQRRERQGTLSLESVEPHLVVRKGQVIDIQTVAPNRAREIIENLMIAANGVMARFLDGRRVPALRRVVRAPKHWDRLVVLAAELGHTLPPKPDQLALAGFLNRRREADPEHFADLSLAVVKLLGPGEYILERRMQAARREGHFGLAVADYVHGTAPNRRYADLVNQRLAKGACAGDGEVYDDAELQAVASRCTEREKAARKVERLVRKQASAAFLANRVGESFTAIVTGAAAKGTYVRVLSPPVEGRVVRNQRGLIVGDTVRVTLVGVDAVAGYVDFAGPPPNDLERKRERTSRKRRAAALLAPRIGEEFEATVTAASPKGTYVRLTDGSAEGRVVRGQAVLTKGQTVRVTLVGTDAVHGFVDFEFREGIAARKLERTRRKQAWAQTLRNQIGEEFAAVVTATSPTATYVRVTSSGIEGRLVRYPGQPEKGRLLTVVLLNADARRGFIDFAAVAAAVTL